jgi:hypothetical protein
MKVSLFVIAALLSTTSWAGALPDGTYKGDGLWNSPLKQGSYKTETKISGEQLDTTHIESTYLLEDGTTKTWAFEVVPSNGNFFKVEVDGKEVGQGYCLSRATVCHYEVSVGNMELEETISYEVGKLYRFGSKVENDRKVMWQEKMNVEQ